jgi:AAHS family 3-hydroxyphenylpropionic acid transporter
MRLLTGIGLGGALPNLVAIAAEASDPERKGFAVGMMYAGLPFGGAVASLVSLFGLHSDWQTIFLVGGTLPLLIVPVLLRLLPDFKIVPKTVSEQMKLTGALDHIFGNGHWLPTILLWASFFFSLLILYLLLNWLPALLVSRGFERQDASIIQIAFNLAGAGGSLVAGLALDSKHRSILVLAIFAALVVALFFLAVLPNNLMLAVLASAFVGIAIIAVQAILYGIAPQCYPAEARGTGVGFAVAAGRFGSVAGPLLAGALVAAGGTSSNVLLAIMPIAIAGGATCLLLISQLRSRQ